MKLDFEAIAVAIPVIGNVKIRDTTGETQEVSPGVPNVNQLIENATEFVNNGVTYDRKCFRKLVEFAIDRYFDRVSIFGSTLLCKQCGDHAISSTLLDSSGESLQVNCERCKAILAAFASDDELSFFRGELMRREKAF